MTPKDIKDEFEKTSISIFALSIVVVILAVMMSCDIVDLKKRVTELELTLCNSCVERLK